MTSVDTASAALGVAVLGALAATLTACPPGPVVREPGRSDAALTSSGCVPRETDGGPPELCNNADDDCDRRIDEDYADRLGLECFVVCDGVLAEGVTVCDGARGVECHLPGGWEECNQ